jgi:hypothetical protein
MRGVVLTVLTLTILAAGSGCGKPEKPGPAPVTEVSSSTPAAPADAHPPIATLDTPREGSTVPNKSWGTGWALDDSGVFQVTATADNGAVAPAKLGQPFPGVKDAYPNLPDSDRAGFIFQVPELPPGPHSLRVEVVAKDGGKAVVTRNFNVQ